MSQEFETATDSKDDLVLTLEVFMGPCQRCGRCFPPPTPLERISVMGFRRDREDARPGAEVPDLHAVTAHLKRHGHGERP